MTVPKGKRRVTNNNRRIEGNKIKTLNQKQTKGCVNCGKTSQTPKSGKANCVSPEEFDQMVDWNQKYPFRNLQPPNGSTIKAYYTTIKNTMNTSVSLRFKHYVTHVENKMNTGNGYIINMSNLVVKNRVPYKPLNQNNNAINMGLCEESTATNKFYSKKNQTSTMADTQINGKFATLQIGLTCAILYVVRKYHLKNICQMNNGQQGFYKYDCKCGSQCPCDGVGMKVLRLIHVTHVSKYMNFPLNSPVHLYHIPTLFMFINGLSSNEIGVEFTPYDFLMSFDAALRIALRSAKGKGLRAPDPTTDRRAFEIEKFYGLKDFCNKVKEKKLPLPSREKIKTTWTILQNK